VLALLIPLGLAYMSQGIRTAIGMQQEEDELIATYLSTYPLFMIVVGVIAGIVFAKRAVDKWRDSVRDEIYLVGEVLHNLDEER
jgi:E3 ubiquitin-protein ligase MARCH6